MSKPGGLTIKWPSSVKKYGYEHEPCPPASRGRGCMHDSPLHTCLRQGCHTLYYTEARHWICVNFELSGQKSEKKDAKEADGSGTRNVPWCPNLAPGGPKERV